MEAEQKRSGEAMKGVRKYERKIKDLTHQVGGIGISVKPDFPGCDW